MVELNSELTITPGTAPTAAKGKMYYDDASSSLKISNDGATFVDLGGAIDFGPDGWFAGLGGFDLDGAVSDALPANVILCDTFTITSATTLPVTNKLTIIVANTVDIQSTAILDAQGLGGQGGSGGGSSGAQGEAGEFPTGGSGGDDGATAGTTGASGINLFGESVTGGTAGGAGGNGGAASITPIIDRGRALAFIIPFALIVPTKLSVPQ